MTFSRIHSKTCRAATGLLLIFLGVCGGARAEDPAPARKNAVVEKAPSLGEKGADFQQLEKRFTRSHSPFEDAPSAMDGVNMVRPPSGGFIIRDKRAQEKLDQQRNWAFATPQDLMQNYMDQEVNRIYGLKQDGDPQTMMERYYKKMSGSATNQARGHNFFGQPQNDPTGNGESPPGDDVSGLWSGLPPSLKNLLGKNAAPGKPGGFSDLFGNPEDNSPEAIRERKERATQIDEFKKILDYQSPASLPEPPPVSGGGSFGAGGQNYFSGSAPAGGFNPGGSVFNPALAPAAPLSPIAPLAPGQPGLTTVTPAPAPVRLPPPVSFSSPQRKY